MRPPNIVLVLTDDQGWGDLSLHGNTNLQTPHIDQMAKDGARFDWFYVQPVCAPTRAEILTGRYFPRTGVCGVTRRAEYLNLDEQTMGDVFKAAGYATGCFGKWHSGSPYPYHPNGRGFDEFYGFCCGHWAYYFDSTLEHNGKEVKGQGFIIDDFTSKAMKFIEDNRDRPFLCYVPFNTPHSPYQVPDRWFDKFAHKDIGMHHRDREQEQPEIIRTVLAMCENIDWNLGRLQDKIAELGLAEDTIFVYLSDNGPAGIRWNGDMRGKKGRTDEGGARVPCLFRWDGHIAPGRCVSPIAGAIDMLPTLADMAGILIQGGKPMDGISLTPLLLENTREEWTGAGRYLVSQSHDMKYTSVRTQQYRFGGHTPGLYDVDKDIGQNTDLAPLYPEVAAQLQKTADAWRKEVIPDEFPARYIPVGYPEFPATYLNAQDGNPTGGIRWSSVHPNASYFIEWKNREADVTWDIDVHNTGDYRIILMYTCPKGDEGSALAVSCQGREAGAILDEPFDPPLRTEGFRAYMNVSYEKEFRSLILGTLRLDKGKAALRLFALSKAGGEVCHVRAIRVEYLP